MTDAAKNLRRGWWASIIVIIISVVAGFLGLYYFVNDINAQGLKIASDKNAILLQNEEVSTLARLKSQATQAQPYLAAINKLLPAQNALIGFPSWVNGLAAAHNVSVNISFTGASAAGSATAAASNSFSMSVDGSLSDITAFLDEMEHTAPQFLLSVDSFDLRANGTSYSLSAQGRVFSQGS